MAFIHQGKASRANAELAVLQTVQQQLLEQPDYYVGFGAASTLLEISNEVATGEMQAKAGDFDTAINHLSRAVRLEDSLRYTEPPDWYFPVRHSLGAVLLESGRANEAEVVYWQDLKKNPDNGYALLGLQQALEAQDKSAQAEVENQRFVAAWRDADIQLGSSRFLTELRCMS